MKLQVCVVSEMLSQISSKMLEAISAQGINRGHRILVNVILAQPTICGTKRLMYFSIFLDFTKQEANRK